MTLYQALEDFAHREKVNGKGKLSVVLVVTLHARQMGLPLDSSVLLTENRGQVIGLGKATVQKLLARHGIEKTLAEEAGRTSRGSIGLMERYVAFLNEQYRIRIVDIDIVEAFWIEAVKTYFSAKPIPVKLDAATGLRHTVKAILAEAEKRQKALKGATVAGAVLQHLVGAKLTLAAPDLSIAHHSFSTADTNLGRPGDFIIGDTAIHVTTTPTEALIAKCSKNLAKSLRPIIVTIPKSIAVAEGLTENAGLSGRIDIFDIEQFVALNLYEWSEFSAHNRGLEAMRLIDAYNKIIDQFETDPSLRLSINEA